MEDRTDGKSVIGLAYPETLEKLAAAGEKLVNRLQQKGFAKAAGPRQKIAHLGNSQKIIDVFGLVSIQKVLVDYGRECLIAGRELFQRRHSLSFRVAA
jgi:hypothetical protein